MKWNPKEDKMLQRAIQRFLMDHNLALPSENLEYRIFIDGVDVYINGDPILEIGLPPVSNYYISKTKFADKYMQIITD